MGMGEAEGTSLLTSVVPVAGWFGVVERYGVVRERKREAAGRIAVVVWRADAAAGRTLAVRKIRATARMAVGVNIVVWWRLIMYIVALSGCRWLRLQLGLFAKVFPDAIGC